jgi:hypothetical protein
MPDNLHDGFSIDTSIGEIRHSTVSEIMGIKVFDPLFKAKPLHLSVRMA